MRWLDLAKAAFAVGLTGLLYGAQPGQTSRYLIDDHVLIRTPDGATLSAVVVRGKGAGAQLPTALEFTIYADLPTDVKRLEYAADRGYVGVVAYSRGKVFSPQRIAPYEYDGRDASAVISWITRQLWSNGKVGMFGGSYDGFTQWAAAKFMPPGLKTIVPYASNNPGNGLPMQDNIFLLVNYAWIYYVTDNKFLNAAEYDNPNWRTLNSRWYASGRSYRDVDRVAGRPNPWLHKLLQHPSYDAYWQSLVPFANDFARINIPVLTITGYYDDGQISALGFLRDHYAYNKLADHYLVIGPWDHLGLQRAHKDSVLRGYQIDPAAQISTPKLTFDWFDFVMRNGKKPALIQDRVNYEVMGENRWRHAPSIAKMSDTMRTLYLTPNRVSRRYYLLSTQKPAKVSQLTQSVDFADRKTTNNDSYPFPILGKKPNLSNGYSFVTSPFSKAVSINGSFDGLIHLVINKRDLDIGLVLYEMMPDGKLFQLSYFTGRASYARDMRKRTLLTPGKIETIPFDQSTLVSRRIDKGSRLLLTLNVNKNPFAQINYGTGKDVSDESILDAKVPLRIEWLTDSYVRVPVSSD